MAVLFYQTNRAKDGFLQLSNSVKTSSTVYQYPIATWACSNVVEVVNKNGKFTYTTKEYTDPLIGPFGPKFYKIYDEEEDGTPANFTTYNAGIPNIYGAFAPNSVYVKESDAVLKDFKPSRFPTDVSSTYPNAMRLGPFTGTFAAGTWVFKNDYIRTDKGAALTFNTSLEIYKGSAANGSNAVNINVSTFNSATIKSANHSITRSYTTYSPTASVTPVVTTISQAANSLELNNEYIFLVPRFNIATAYNGTFNISQIVRSSKVAGLSAYVTAPDLTFKLRTSSIKSQTTTLERVIDQKSLASNLQKLSPDTIVTLFKLDATNRGAGIMYFHAGTNELTNDVIWQGQTYIRYPIEAEGFEWTGSGTLPRPVIRAANFGGILSAIAMQHNDLVGATLYRKRTFVKYLDSANFPKTNPLADPNVHFPDEIWTIDRKSKENRTMMEFELVAGFDVTGIKLPRRQCIQNSCSWRYRSYDSTSGNFNYDNVVGCPYTGTVYFDANDNPTTADKDVCGKRLRSCELRFNPGGDATVSIPYGGFPGVGLIR